jgi:arabinose-5-phosphate isomerase
MQKRSSLDIQRDCRGSFQRTITLFEKALGDLQRSVDHSLGVSLSDAVRLIASCRGRTIVTGMGKSGHVGRKIAATLASTGSRAVFLHPAEAAHGDLGVIAPDDVLLALSWSGETTEVAKVVQYCRSLSVPSIGVTSNQASALGQAATVCVAVPPVIEACPHRLAPTTSTLIQATVGECLAVALIEERQFDEDDYRALHPSGMLGLRLRKVTDIMRVGDRMPIVVDNSPVIDAIGEMSTKGMGCVGVRDSSGCLVGIVTDGDLRRHMEPDLFRSAVAAIMTRDPKTISIAASAEDAVVEMRASRISVLFVVEQNRPVGILHLHDILGIAVL